MDDRFFCPVYPSDRLCNSISVASALHCHRFFPLQCPSLAIVLFDSRFIDPGPFPPLIEAMLLELIFELLREAGLRLPSRVGQTIGIVGGWLSGMQLLRRDWFLIR